MGPQGGKCGTPGGCRGGAHRGRVVNGSLGGGAEPHAQAAGEEVELVLGADLEEAEFVLLGGPRGQAEPPGTWAARWGPSCHGSLGGETGCPWWLWGGVTGTQPLPAHS